MLLVNTNYTIGQESLEVTLNCCTDEAVETKRYHWSLDTHLKAIPVISWLSSFNIFGLKLRSLHKSPLYKAIEPSVNPTAINKRLSATHSVVGFSDFGNFVERTLIGLL